ncbi:MAG: hypothetical protein ABSH53_16330 [Holophaga sp.]|jgi:hypothetical protein
MARGDWRFRPGPAPAVFPEGGRRSGEPVLEIARQLILPGPRVGFRTRLLEPRRPGLEARVVEHGQDRAAHGRKGGPFPEEFRPDGGIPEGLEGTEEQREPGLEQGEQGLPRGRR